MISKILSGQSAGMAAIILAGGYAINGVLSFFRSVVLAETLGADEASDAYYQGFLLPDLLLSFLVMGAVTGALMPIYIKTRERSQEESETLVRSFVLVICLMIILAIVLSLMNLSLSLELLLGSEPSQELMDVSRVLLWSPLIFALSNALGMILQSERRFLSVALSPILYTLGIICGAVLLGESMGPVGVAYGAICGAILHLGIRLLDWPRELSVIGGVRWSPELGRILLLGIPKTLALTSFTLAFTLIARYLDGEAYAGVYTAWTYARDVVSFPVLLFGLAISSAVSPLLARLIAREKWEDALKRYDDSSGYILSLSVPAAVGIWAVGPVLTEALFQRGAFGPEAVETMTSLLLVLCLGLPLEAMNHLLSRILLMHEQTGTVMVGKVGFLMGVGGVLWLGPEGIMTVAWAFCAGIACEMILLQGGILWTRDLRKMHWARSLVMNWQVVFSSLGMGMAIWWMRGVIDSSLISLLLMVGTGGGLYLVLMWLMGARQLSDVREMLLKRRVSEA